MCEWTCICVKSFRYENTEQVLKTHLKNSRLGKEREREEEEQATSNELKFFKAEEERLIERAGSAEVQKKQWGSGLTVCKATCPPGQAERKLNKCFECNECIQSVAPPKVLQKLPKQKIFKQLCYARALLRPSAQPGSSFLPVHPSSPFHFCCALFGQLCAPQA